MQKRNENKFRMFKAVWQVILKFIAVWTSNVGFTEVTDEFGSNMKKIEGNRGSAETGSNGITKDKILLNEALMDSIMEISGPLSTWASRTKNLELFDKVCFTDSQLEDLTDEGLAQAGRDLAKMAQQYQETLAKFNVTPEEIANLQKLSDEYSAKTSLQRQSITNRSTALDQQESLFRETSLLLKNQLDQLVNTYRRSNPEFVTEYFKARKIVNYGIRHEEQTETVVNGVEKK